MHLSKKYRYTTAFALLVFMVINLYNTYHTDYYAPVQIPNWFGIVTEVAIMLITMVLVGWYFFKRQWKLVFYTFVLMDGYNIFLMIFDPLNPDLINTNFGLYALLGNLSFLFIAPLFDISILISKTARYEWLKLFSLASLLLTAIFFFSSRFGFSINIQLVMYVQISINILLVMHFLLPDYQAKVADEILDDSV